MGLTRLRHRFDSLGCVTLTAIDALLCFAASNGTPATTEAAFADDWGAQMARAAALAEADEAAGKIAPHHLDGGGAEPSDDEPAEDPAEGGEPKPAAKKPEAKAKPKAGEEETADPKENEGAVAPQERAKWREQKRKERERLNEDRRKLDGALAEARQKYAPLEAVSSMLDAGDLIGAVEKLTGKSWNDVQKIAIARAKGQDPRVEQALKKAEEAQAKLDRIEREREEREQAAESARARAEWIGGLREELGAEEDEIGALAKHAKLGFLDDVYAIQAREYDPHSGETISAREAAEQVIDNWRSLYDDLSEVFGERGASNPDAAKAAAHRKGSPSAKPGANAPKTLSQRKAAEASPRAPVELSEEDWLRKHTKRLREARDE